MGEGDDEDTQCSFCSQYCHFSAVECDCDSHGRVMCPAHAGMLCACPPSRWRLAFRYSLAELSAYLSGVFGAAARVGAWPAGVRSCGLPIFVLCRMLRMFSRWRYTQHRTWMICASGPRLRFWYSSHQLATAKLRVQIPRWSRASMLRKRRLRRSQLSCWRQRAASMQLRREVRATRVPAVLMCCCIVVSFAVVHRRASLDIQRRS